MGENVVTVVLESKSLDALPLLLRMADAAGFIVKQTLAFVEVESSPHEDAPLPWWVQDTPYSVVAKVNPIALYNAPDVAAKFKLTKVTWPMKVREVRGEWLRITDGSLWCRALDCALLDAPPQP